MSGQFERRKPGVREALVSKFSGLGMCDYRGTINSMLPFVTAVIEAFGVDRCMFASNFLVDIKFSDYQTFWNAYD
ncbi:MAG: amidohydrolase family protein [Verrucomicrobia bacterium]|nr:amidohydrolase family protein [Verrucomicrobiota bacterium]